MYHTTLSCYALSSVHPIRDQLSTLLNPPSQALVDEGGGLIPSTSKLPGRVEGDLTKQTVKLKPDLDELAEVDLVHFIT